MEMNSVMATEIVAAEVEHIVLPQIVSIKQASRMLGLPPYYLRRLCKEVPGVAFQSGIKWYIKAVCAVNMLLSCRSMPQ